jgi:Sec-independent protein translocase protein TatA
MEIFGIGGFEIALIIIIALVVAGPARMAVWARTLGRWVAKMRQLWSITAAQLQRELDDAGVDFKVPKDIPTRQSLMQEVTRSQTFKDLTKPVEEVQLALNESKSAVTETVDEVKNVNTTIKNAMKAKSLKPAPMKPNSEPTPTAQDNGANFGTWGGANGQAADLGTWGSAPAEKEQS